MTAWYKLWKREGEDDSKVATGSVYILHYGRQCTVPTEYHPWADALTEPFIGHLKGDGTEETSGTPGRK